MARNDWQHAEQRAAHVVDERQRFVEGAIIDWLIRTGQWDPQADEKIRQWLEQRQATVAGWEHSEPAPEAIANSR